MRKLHEKMLEFVGDASSFDGHRHNSSSTKNPIGRCLTDHLDMDQQQLLKLYVKKPLTKGSGSTKPYADHLRKYNENTCAIVDSLVSMARGDYLRQALELTLDVVSAKQRAAIVADMARVTLAAQKVCLEYTAGKPREIRDEDPDVTLPEVIILNRDVPDVALPLPETSR